jgi:hypothetical protein
MPDNSGLADFKQGVSLLRKGKSSEALEYLRRAAELQRSIFRFPWNTSRICAPACEAPRTDLRLSSAVALCKRLSGNRTESGQLRKTPGTCLTSNRCGSCESPTT